ncbi:MAG: hypothetical protein JWO36_2681 [Myxococcales bacterium]|nr:hypothetical protein [Myxococcales bacterium]
MRAALVLLFVTACRIGFDETSRPGPDAATDGAGMPGDGAAAVCGEATCQPVVGKYVSHFTQAGCTGTESYYTPYFSGTAIPNPDHKINSWDGNGVAGTIYRTVTNRSAKDAAGLCHDDWPNGNTLDYFVTIYR